MAEKKNFSVGESRFLKIVKRPKPYVSWLWLIIVTKTIFKRENWICKQEKINGIDTLKLFLYNCPNFISKRSQVREWRNFVEFSLCFIRSSSIYRRRDFLFFGGIF